MSDKSCEYVSGEEDKLGIKSEIIDEQGSVTCEADAEIVLRGRSGQALRISRQKYRLITCKEHGEYLVSESELDWEMLGRGEDMVEKVIEVREGENQE